METLKYKYQKALRVQAACQRSIKLYKNPPQNAPDAELEAYTVSVIKHIELFYEMLLQFLKCDLISTHSIKVSGFKNVLKKSLAHSFMDAQELKQLLNFVENRNTEACMYEKAARTMCESMLEEDFPLMSNLLSRVVAQSAILKDE